MAHNDSAPHGGHGVQHAGAVGAAHTAAHGAHAHPTWKQYKWVALILTVITIFEVWIYYIPSFVATKLFVPTLLILSAIKFAIVVLFYMHLKYDSRLFRALFTGPLIIAIITLISLLFLFGHIAIRLGA